MQPPISLTLWHMPNNFYISSYYRRILWLFGLEVWTLKRNIVDMWIKGNRKLVRFVYTVIVFVSDYFFEHLCCLFLCLFVVLDYVVNLTLVMLHLINTSGYVYINITILKFEITQVALHMWKSHLQCRVNSMVGDGLGVQGAMLLSQNNQVSVPQVFNQTRCLAMILNDQARM